MAKFELTYNGERYEVDAPDEASAMAAFQSQIVGSTPSNEERYNSALETVRQSQFPDMTDAQWADYSSTVLAPQGFQGIAQQGQTFGFGDEINAGIGAFGSQVRNWLGDQSAPGFGEAYGQYSELEQARRDLGRDQLGLLAPVADVAGGFSIAGPARAAGGTIAPVTTASLTSPQTLSNAVIGGTTLGYVGGFGSTDGGIEERNAGGAIGSGIGAVTGRFGPTIANAVGGAYGNVANLLARNNAARDAGIDPGVARYLTQALSADDALGPQGLARMNAAGGQAMLVDAAPSTRTMLDTAIQSSGTAGRTARDAIGSRLAADSAAISDALDNTLGLPEGIASARARISAETQGARGAAYDAAYSSPIDYASGSGQLLEELLARVPQSAINRANQLMGIRGERSRQILAQVSDDGSVVYEVLPDVRQIDYITRALNEEARNGIGQGAMGGQTDIGSSLQSLSGDIRSVLGNHVPAYENALNVAGDSIQRSQAVQLGADLLNANTSMDDIIRRSQRLSPAEREGIAIGLRSQIDNLMARVRRTLGNPDTETREAANALVRLSTREARTKIEAALGEDVARELFQELDRAGTSFELAASVANNSQTFARQNQRDVVNSMAGGNGVIDTLRRGQPVNAGQRIVQALTGMTDDAVAARADDINNQIVRMLVAQGPQAQVNYNTLSRLSNRTYGNEAVAAALAGNINRAALPGSISGQRYIQGSRQ